MVCCRGGLSARPKSLVDHRSLTGGLLTRPYTHVSYISKIILHFHKTAPGHVPGDNGVTDSLEVIVTPPGYRPVRYCLAHPTKNRSGFDLRP